MVIEFLKIQKEFANKKALYFLENHASANQLQLFLDYCDLFTSLDPDQFEILQAYVSSRKDYLENIDCENDKIANKVINESQAFKK